MVSVSLGSESSSRPSQSAGSSLKARVLFSLIGFVAAIAVTIGLAIWSGIGLSDIATQFRNSPFWLVPLVAVLTGFQIALSAFKWRLVLSHISPEMTKKETFGFFYFVSVASAFLSHLMTSYLSAIVVRSWAAKRAHSLPLGKGASTSLFEQLFDVAVILAALAPTVLVYIVGGSFVLWAALTSASLILGLSVFLILGRISQNLPAGDAHGSIVARVFAAFAGAQNAGLFRAATVVQLYSISVLRYLLILVRAPLTAVTLFTGIGIVATTQGFTVVQSMQLASLTPGNLGIQEWSWTGVLSLTGVSVETAAAFAIAYRLVTFTAMSLVAILSGGAYLFLRKPNA